MNSSNPLWLVVIFTENSEISPAPRVAFGPAKFKKSLLAPHCPPSPQMPPPLPQCGQYAFSGRPSVPPRSAGNSRKPCAAASGTTLRRSAELITGMVQGVEDALFTKLFEGL